MEIVGVSPGSHHVWLQHRNLVDCNSQSRHRSLDQNSDESGGSTFAADTDPETGKFHVWCEYIYRTW